MKESRQFGLHGGDLGVIGLALAFAVLGFYLMFAPPDLHGLFASHPPPPSKEVTIDLKTYKAPPLP